MTQGSSYGSGAAAHEGESSKEMMEELLLVGHY
jgi:hypothetical protein